MVFVIRLMLFQNCAETVATEVRIDSVGAVSLWHCKDRVRG